MHLFGNMGPEGLDGCCTCPTFLALLGTFVAAAVGFNDNKPRAVALAALLCGFVGTVTLVALSTARTMDVGSDDALNADDARRLLWGWVASAVITTVAASGLFVKRRFNLGGDEPPAPPNPDAPRWE